MSNFILEREIRGLQGDLNMNKMAVGSVQRDMMELLHGEMGEDINAVLSGERTVRPETGEVVRHKFKTWLKRLFKAF